jgi:nucleoside-diphosphate-sugar epimerase
VIGRALVTGVTGFVGAHVARALVADGVVVHAVVRPDSRLDRVPDLRDTVALHVDDGSTDALVRAVDAARPDTTFHLATNFIAEHGEGDVGPLVQDNVAFPSRLVDALAGHRGVFVNVGTAWQHVDGARFLPKNLYAATKQAFEDMLAYSVVSGRVRALTVNLYDSYGPLDQRGKLLSALIEALRTGDVLAASSGRQLVDLVHVDDIVRGLRGAAAACAADALPADVPYFSLSSGRPRTLRELVDVLGAVAGRPVPVEWDARPDRAGDMTSPWDAGPAVPGWEPAIDLETGLTALLADAGVTRA